MKNIIMAAILTVAASKGLANAAVAESVGQQFVTAAGVGKSAAQTLITSINAAAAANADVSAAVGIATNVAKSQTCVGACDQAVTGLVSALLSDDRTPQIRFKGWPNLMETARSNPATVQGFVKKARDQAGSNGDIGEAAYNLIASSQGFTGTAEQIRAQVDNAVAGACKLPN